MEGKAGQQTLSLTPMQMRQGKIAKLYIERVREPQCQEIEPVNVLFALVGHSALNRISLPLNSSSEWAYR